MRTRMPLLDVLVPSSHASRTHQPSQHCRPARRYFVQMLRCSMRDASVLVEMSKVNQMVVPPTHMFGPAISTKVAALTVRDALGNLLRPLRRLGGGGGDDAADTSAANA